MNNKVLVLMSTFNGSKYIREQINSILIQKNVDTYVWIRDDGSTDDSIDIINEYAKKYHKIKVLSGENLRPAKSFMWLVKNCDINGFNYFAFCDQDDVWIDDKLKSAVDKLESHNESPALYYCATQNVDSELKKIDVLFTEPKHTTSLIDSIATGSLIPGCTMVFNRKLMDLLRLYSPRKLTMHDTWTHLVCLSCGGVVIADEAPHILYRQHENNVLGTKKKSLIFRLNRLNSLNNEYSDMVKEIYDNYKQYLSKSSNDVIQKCINYNRNIIDNISFFIEGIKSSLSTQDKFIFLYKILIRFF